MRCSKCKKSLKSNDSFCPKCGTNNSGFNRYKPEVTKPIDLNPKIAKPVKTNDTLSSIKINDLPNLNDIKINTIKDINKVELDASLENITNDKKEEVVETKKVKTNESVEKKTNPNYSNYSNNNTTKPTPSYNRYNDSNVKYDDDEYEDPITKLINKYKNLKTNTKNNPNPNAENYEKAASVLGVLAFIFVVIFPILGIVFSSIGLGLSNTVNNEKMKVVNIVALVTSIVATFIYLASL